ncbi:MAG TPA: hypothetical protein VGX50_15265, partial [Longimicrobium sp.]|nr:hypothetical protein [Longimicrobium sp.]
MAIVLRPACAAGQERAPAVGMLVTIDHRLLVSEVQQRATLAGARQRVERPSEDWNLYGLMEHMAGGIVPGLVIGVIVGAATAEDGLDGMTSVLTGGILGMGIGMGVGGIVYT